jgi:NADH:ubiquinone oxidoreductase subunit 4 (subunit M)
MLIGILLILIINILLIILCLPRSFKLNIIELKIITLYLNILVFIFSLGIWFFFDNNTLYYQFTYFTEIGNNFLINYNLNFSFGIDGYSLFFVIITTFICPLCLLVEWYTIPVKPQYVYLLCFIIIEFFLIIVFTTFDFFFFFFFF